MIIETDEIKKLLHLLAATGKGNVRGQMAVLEQEQLIEFLSIRPYLLYFFGFNQSMIFENTFEARTYLYKSFGLSTEHAFTPGINFRALFRKPDNNQWYLLERRLGSDNWNAGDPPARLFFTAENGERENLELEVLAEKLRFYSNSGIILQNENILLPGVSSFDTIGIINSPISNAARILIQKLHAQKVRLSDISWKDLEDIIAELFRDQGLKVKPTKRTRDGGRDLVVAGELFPGTETIMAVEITAQSKVGRGKMSKALQDNRHYPLIMLATSGTFSSGVINEVNNPEYTYRLLLRDQKSINEWINNHSSIR